MAYDSESSLDALKELQEAEEQQRKWKEKHYYHRVICTNCGEEHSVEIPKGTTVEHFIISEMLTCEHCECDTLVPVDCYGEKRGDCGYG